jgi:site-specific recombinase XerD
VVQFVTSLQDRFSARSMKQVRTALRSLFRFLRMKGYCDEKLELAIPAVAHWRMATLPRCLNEQQLKQVLAFDPRTPCGLRDRAIVSCLAMLGLRPRELAELRLEDIDWRGGTLRLRTRKTRRGAVLPLPREAGRAVVTYLRKARPRTAERRVWRHVASSRTSITMPRSARCCSRPAGCDLAVDCAPRHMSRSSRCCSRLDCASRRRVVSPAATSIWIGAC